VKNHHIKCLLVFVFLCCFFCGSALAFEMPGLFGGKKEPAFFDLKGFAQNKKSMSDDYVKVENPEYLKGVKKVFIPSFQVEFITKSSASADSYGFGGKGSTSSISYTLKGLDDAALQTITDTLYADFVGDLKAMGLEVVPWDQLQANPLYLEILKVAEKTPSKQKSRTEPKAGESVVFTPQGMPFYFTLYDQKAGLSALLNLASTGVTNAPHNIEAHLIDALGATMLKVRLVVGFADVKAGSSSGTSGSTSGKMRFSVASKWSEVISGNKIDTWEGGFGEQKTKSYALRTANMTKFTLLKPIISDEPITKEIIGTTSTAAKVGEGVMNALSAFTGISSLTREYDAVADAPAYDAAGRNYLGAVREMIALKMKENL
jgi:hypothetical protein